APVNTARPDVGSSTGDATAGTAITSAAAPSASRLNVMRSQSYQVVGGGVMFVAMNARARALAAISLVAVVVLAGCEKTSHDNTEKRMKTENATRKLKEY